MTFRDQAASMPARALTLCLAAALLFAAPAALAQEPLALGKLRCEYRTDPLGIDITAPRLSWEVSAERRGARQTAYQVLVASTEALLAAGTGDRWDSGQVASDATAHIVYEGTPLGSRDACWWKVRVWDENGTVSDWSVPARWTMGLLDPADWQAQWVSMDRGATGEVLDFSGTQWIWAPQVSGANPATPILARAITLPTPLALTEARVLVTVDDQFDLYVNGEKAGASDGQTDAWRRPQVIDIAHYLQAGANVIAIDAEDTGSAAGALAKVVIRPEGAAAVTVVTDGSWQSVADVNTATGEAVQVVANYGASPWGTIDTGSAEGVPAPMRLRKAFTVSKPVKRAEVYLSALGIYDFQVNGQRVDDTYFSPGWTDYNQRLYYETLDVTDALTQGENVLGVEVADGWYAGTIGWEAKREHYGSQTQLLAQLEIEYADGSRETVVTGPDWRAATGPTLEADFLMGETYDARLETPGWSAPGFDDSAWPAVVTTPGVTYAIEATPSVPVREVAGYNPVELTEPQPGVYVFNMGQEFAGFVRLRVTGEAGDEIVLRFAERLNPDGTLYTENLRRARCIDRYICKGDGEETWAPRYTFHGFQYVELTGLSSAPGLDAIEGISLSSDLPVTGYFECSDPVSNQLFSNIVHTQLANFIDIPTDCPQRDERLGWTGDAQIYVRTASYTRDVAPFFTKWLVTLDDAQRDNGEYPDVAPRLVAPNGGVAAWGDAGVICPWTIYDAYGDLRVLEKHYENMAKWVTFCQNNSTNLLRPASGYGDWLSIQDDTPKDVLATAYFAYSTKLVAKSAEALGKTADAAQYNSLFDQIRAAWNDAYVGDDVAIHGNTQTCYVMALAFDLLDEADRPRALERLVEKIRGRDTHVSTGFVGTKDLMIQLSHNGQTDIAYELFHNDTFPSWGFSIKYGATTIWERWDGWTPENGFQNPGMNSFAHYSFGAVGQWMFETVGGIRALESGFGRILVKPEPGGELTWAKTRFDSIRGPIATGWSWQGSSLHLDVTVPANTTARIHVPVGAAAVVLEGGVSAAEAEGLTYVGIEDGAAVYDAVSGVYSFVSKDAREGESLAHSADVDESDTIEVSELLRVIQLYNAEAYHCAALEVDGYAPGPGDQACQPHDSDYAAPAWHIELPEVLRLVQFFQAPGYAACPGAVPPTEDGFCLAGV